jgi:hypothetical protein
MALVGGVFGVVLMAMAGVVGIVTLTLGFAGIRMFGQGALGLVATTAPAPLVRPSPRASRSGSPPRSARPCCRCSRSLRPPSSRVGWRAAWIVTGLTVWLVVVPIATRGMIDRPHDVGQQADGDAPAPRRRGGARAAAAAAVVHPGEAIRTPMFWAVAGATAATGMIGTGLAFHQIDLLGEQGLTPGAGGRELPAPDRRALTGHLAVGSMVDRFAARWVLPPRCCCWQGGDGRRRARGPRVDAIAYGVTVGAAGASARALEAASFPKLFGLAPPRIDPRGGHRDQRRSTAFGPLALSLGRDLTGSYEQVLLVLLVFPARSCYRPDRDSRADPPGAVHRRRPGERRPRAPPVRWSTARPPARGAAIAACDGPDARRLLPLTDPGAVFAVLFLLVLLGPLVAERLRLPGIIGLVVGGMLIGPNVTASSTRTPSSRRSATSACST